MVAALLNAGVDATWKDDKGNTYLQTATNLKDVLIVQALLIETSVQDLQHKLQHINNNSENVLHIAARTGDATLVDILMTHLLKPEFTETLKKMLNQKNTSNGDTPLHIASRGKGAEPANLAIVKKLVEAGASLNLRTKAVGKKPTTATYVAEFNITKKPAGAAQDQQRAVWNYLKGLPHSSTR